MVGSNKTASALVIALGNIRNGMTIPFKTPKIIKDSDVLRPYFFNIIGISTASKLCKMLKNNRFPVSGSVSFVSSFTNTFVTLVSFEYLLICRTSFFGERLINKDSVLYILEAISPITRPTAATSKCRA